MADYAIHDTTLTDISNVIRKKEGSSALIDPADYADRINLMGMLEKKIIVSSPICDFTDGSDDVPTDFVKIFIPANLDGKSSVSEKHTGRNLFNVADYSQIYTDRDGVDSYNYRYMIIQLKPNTTYTVSQNSGEYSGTPIILINNALPVGGANYFDLRKASDTKTFTTDSTGRLYIGSVNSYDDVAYARLQVCNVQIEFGSTAHSYEPFINPKTYSANLGRTVHGAEVDFVSGEGKEICGKIVFDGSESRWAEYATGNGYAIPLTGMKRGTWYTSPLALSYPLPKAPNNDNLGVRIGVNNDGVYVVQANTIEGVTDLVSFKAWLSENPLTIIYPLDTEIDFTFDGQEIDTMLGYNCFISEDGDTSVAYRASGTVYNYPAGEEASF